MYKLQSELCVFEGRGH